MLSYSNIIGIIILLILGIPYSFLSKFGTSLDGIKYALIAIELFFILLFL